MRTTFAVLTLQGAVPLRLPVEKRPDLYLPCSKNFVPG